MEESCGKKSQVFDENKDGVVVDECGESSSGSNCLESVNQQHCSSDGFSSPATFRCTFHHDSFLDVSRESENSKLEKQGSTFSGMCLFCVMMFFWICFSLWRFLFACFQRV